MNDLPPTFAGLIAQTVGRLETLDDCDRADAALDDLEADFRNAIALIDGKPVVIDPAAGLPPDHTFVGSTAPSFTAPGDPTLADAPNRDLPDAADWLAWDPPDWAWRWTPPTSPYDQEVDR